MRRSRSTIGTRLVARLSPLLLTALVAACGGGTGGGTTDGGGAIPTSDCDAYTPLTVFNQTNQTITQTHVFVDGDVSNFVTFGPGGIPPGSWGEVDLRGWSDRYVAIHCHFGDGSVDLEPTETSFKYCQCIGGVTFVR